MERKPVYRRVLLKISGEALAGEKKTGLDFGVIGEVCEAVKRCVDMGVEVGVVIGGGNFWRGVKDGEGKIERTRADHMGMLATVMNCLAVADVMEQHGVDVRVQMRIGSCSIWPGAAGYLAKSFTPAGTFRSYSVILSSMSSAGLNHSEWSSMCPASILERSRTSLISLSNSWLLWFIKEMYCSLSCSFST